MEASSSAGKNPELIFNSASRSQKNADQPIFNKFRRNQNCIDLIKITTVVLSIIAVITALVVIGHFVPQLVMFSNAPMFSFMGFTGQVATLSVSSVLFLVGAIAWHLKARQMNKQLQLHLLNSQNNDGSNQGNNSLHNSAASPHSKNESTQPQVLVNDPEDGEDKVDEEKEALKTENATLKEANKTLQEQASNVGFQHSLVSGNNGTLAQSLKDVKQELRDAQKALKKRQQELTEKDKTLQEKNGEVTHWQVKVISLETDIEVLKIENGQLKKENVFLATQVKQEMKEQMKGAIPEKSSETVEFQEPATSKTLTQKQSDQEIDVLLETSMLLASMAKRKQDLPKLPLTLPKPQSEEDLQALMQELDTIAVSTESVLRKPISDENTKLIDTLNSELTMNQWLEQIQKSNPADENFSKILFAQPVTEPQDQEIAIDLGASRMIAAIQNHYVKVSLENIEILTVEEKIATIDQAAIALKSTANVIAAKENDYLSKSMLTGLSPSGLAKSRMTMDAVREIDAVADVLSQSVMQVKATEKPATQLGALLNQIRQGVLLKHREETAKEETTKEETAKEEISQAPPAIGMINDGMEKAKDAIMAHLADAQRKLQEVFSEENDASEWDAPEGATKGVFKPTPASNLSSFVPIWMRKKEDQTTTTTTTTYVPEESDVSLQPRIAAPEKNYESKAALREEEKNQVSKVKGMLGKFEKRS